MELAPLTGVPSMRTASHAYASRRVPGSRLTLTLVTVWMFGCCRMYSAKPVLDGGEVRVLLAEDALQVGKALRHVAEELAERELQRVVG